MTTYQDYKSCIDACLACASACNYCASSCTKEEDVKMIIDRFTAESSNLFNTKIENFIPQGKRLYIKTTDDKEFPITLQEQMALNLLAETAEIKSGHLPMLSEPRHLAMIMNDFMNDLERPTALHKD